MTEDRRALLAGLLADLDAESQDLDARVAGLDGDGWTRSTPAAGWDIRDTVNHLAATDRDAVLAATDPEGFAAHLQRIAGRADSYVDQLVEDARSLPLAQVLPQWRSGRAAFQQALAAHDGRRIPWFGPAMSPASFVTARIMETWAHGQDVADALGQRRAPTDRLRAVAEIGYRAMPFAYAARGRQAPQVPVHVALTGASGASWTWGPCDAVDRVAGTALDFCLLVTQRRNLADLDLQVTGPVAREWAEIAQAFAGPPGSGRAPGSVAPG